MFQFSIIGSGNVAYHLHSALTGAGATCEAVVLRSPKQLTWENRTSQESSLNHLSSEMIIIAVNDPGIEKVLKDYTFPKDSIVVHTAGSISMDVFQEHSIPHYGVFYPLQTLSQKVPVKYQDLPIYIEGSSTAVERFLIDAGKLFSRKVDKMDSFQRVNSHIAAVIASNFTNHLLNIAENLMKENDLNPEIIYPLIDETIRKFKEKGGFNSQTGPARRKDESTISKHLAKLNDPDIKTLYADFSHRIIKLYHQDDKKSGQ